MTKAIGITNNPSLEQSRLKKKYPGLTDWMILETGLDRSHAMIMSVYLSVSGQDETILEKHAMDPHQKDWSIFMFRY